MSDERSVVSLADGPLEGMTFAHPVDQNRVEITVAGVTAVYVDANDKNAYGQRVFKLEENK